MPNPLSIKFALLATGDELIQGDILNTNGQAIANLLTEQGFKLGNHALCSDEEDDIVKCMRFLLEHHDVLIMTGGLGPTSDDRTRYALSKVIEKPLIFNEENWKGITERFKICGIECGDSNRQQALFPEGAIILKNSRGSAAGCHVQYQNKNIYMLPGPPHECLTMFKEHVLPSIIDIYGKGNSTVFKWRLYSVIEADIATIFDNLIKDYPCTSGYRIDFPYLEVKLLTTKTEELEPLIAEINTLFQPHQITAGFRTACDRLKHALKDFSGSIVIDDLATGGALEKSLLTPETRNQLEFHSGPSRHLEVHIRGLDEYWNEAPLKGKTNLSINFKWGNITHALATQIPYRNKFVVSYAVEYIAWQICLFLLDKAEIQPR